MLSGHGVLFLFCSFLFLLGVASKFMKILLKTERCRQYPLIILSSFESETNDSVTKQNIVAHYYMQYFRAGTFCIWIFNFPLLTKGWRISTLSIKLWSNQGLGVTRFPPQTWHSDVEHFAFIPAPGLTMTAQKRTELDKEEPWLELNHTSKQFDKSEEVTLINILIIAKLLNAWIAGHTKIVETFFMRTMRVVLHT